jgi:predicted Zn finger-like uncharacterized protein
MILECPACQARFAVADAQIPLGGRTVRCGRCATQWHVEKPVEQGQAEAPVHTSEAPAVAATDDFLQQLEAAMAAPRGQASAPLKPGFNLPVVARKKLSPKPFMIAAPAIAALWLVLSFITYFPAWMQAPGLKGVYAALGITPTQGLVFSDVTMERTQEGSKTKFILAGSIRNHSNTARAVPTVRVTLRDKTDNAIWGRDYPVNAELKAGEVYPFRITNVETVFASNVSSIVVDMGNPLQLLVR